MFFITIGFKISLLSNRKSPVTVIYVSFFTFNNNTIEFMEINLFLYNIGKPWKLSVSKHKKGTS